MKKRINVLAKAVLPGFLALVMGFGFMNSSVIATEMPDSVSENEQNLEVSIEEPMYPVLDHIDVPEDANIFRAEDLVGMQPEADTKVTSVQSTELTATSPQSWSLSFSGSTLNISIHDESITASTSAAVDIRNSSSDRLGSEWGIISNKNGTLSISLANNTTYPDGTYTVILFKGENGVTTGTIMSFAKYQITISEGEYYFTDSNICASEINFVSAANSSVDPQRYNDIPLYYYQTVSNMDAIKTKALEVTNGCTTDEQKIKELHDWMCLNFAYDYEQLLNRSYYNAADPEWVFENKTAVCSGFSRLFNIMATSVGVPCIDVIGYGAGGGSIANGTNTSSLSSNHEWNMVYLNDSWRILDVTWDCSNKYYGTHANGSSYIDVSGKAGGYAYYGIPAFNFGVNHYSEKISAYPYAKSLTITVTPEKTAYNCSDTAIEKSGVFTCNLSDETINQQYGLYSSILQFSKPDFTLLGTQTVKVSYYNVSTGYNITVSHKDLKSFAEKAATCLSAGNKAYWYCSACNNYYSDNGSTKTTAENVTIPIKQDGHDFADVSYSKNATSHYRSCNLCGNTIYENHSYGEWITDTTEGKKTRNCSVCGYKDVAVIPVSHVHTLIHVDRKEATCSVTGNIEYWHCTVDNCGACFADGAGMVSVDPSSVILNMKSHDVEIDSAVPATYTSKGKTEGTHCKICKKTLIAQTDVDMLNYTVVYHGNGADAGSMANSTYNYATGGTLKSAVYSKTGYRFSGWNLKADGTGISVAVGEDAKNLAQYADESEGVITLYAQWTKDQDNNTGNDNNNNTGDDSGNQNDNTGNNSNNHNDNSGNDNHDQEDASDDTTVQIESFVSRMYTVALKRDAESQGLNDWSSQLQDKENDGAGIAFGFIMSQEFKNKNLSNEEYVTTLYETFFNREPDASGYQDWMNQLNKGIDRGVVLAGFVNSAEFSNLCEDFGILRGYMHPDGTAANAGIAQFVSRLYTEALQRDGEATGINDWTMKIATKQTTAEYVATTGFFNSPEFQQKQLTDSEFLDILYATFFGREADETGKNEWLAKLAKGTSRDQVIRGFSKSQEFANLLSSFGL